MTETNRLLADGFASAMFHRAKPVSAGAMPLRASTAE